MKNFLLVVLSIFAMETSFAQTASDYYLPMCIGNQTVLYAYGNGYGWSGRNFTYTFIKTDTIGGITYFVEEGKEYSWGQYGGVVSSSVFAKTWLREDVNGNILLKKIVMEETDSLIFPSELIILSNNYFTVGYSINQIVMTGYSIRDSVISTNATFGGFTNCIQIRSTDIEDTITGIEDVFYANGVGRVGSNRIFSISSSHTSNFGTAYITACAPIIDTLDPVNTIDTCLGPNIDYYVTNIQVDTFLNTVTVTWVFQDSTLTNQFIATYPFQNMGNNMISITLQCSKTTTTYYKPINISSSSLGINESTETNSKTEIYPVPAFDIVIVKINRQNNEPLTMNIYDILGALVKTEILEQDQQKISINNLSNGLYLVEIKSKEWSEKQKLIIQK